MFAEELRLLFDAGDGVSAHLLGKSRKAERIALTHADRDHVTGLLQLQQLNARPNNPIEVYYPADSRGLTMFAEFCRAFDPWSGPHVAWTPVRPDHDVPLENGLKLKVMRNTHVPSPEGVVKSVSYFLVREVRKLRPELRGLAGEEIARLRAEQGEEALTYVEERGVLAYAGDTGVTLPDPWKGCAILVHEATFLCPEDMEGGRERDQQHSVLPDVLAMSREAGPEALILNHFSSRYHREEIESAVKRTAADLRLPFPVYAIPPGVVVPDVLASEPLWSGV